MSPKKTHLLITFILFDIFLTLDQLTKYLATQHFIQPQEIIPNLLTFTYATNTGVAWSFPVPQLTLFIGIPLIILLVTTLFYKFFDFSQKATQLAYSLIVAGSIGNYIDRLRFGHVIDFISVRSWPIFNLADSYISIAAFIIVLFYAKMERLNLPSKT